MAHLVQLTLPPRCLALAALLATALFCLACSDGDAQTREPAGHTASTTVTALPPGTPRLPDCADVGGYSSADHPDCIASLPVSVGGTSTLPRGLLTRTYFADFVGSGHVLYVGTGYDRTSADAWVEIDTGSHARKVLASSKDAQGHPLLASVLAQLGLK